MKPNSHWRNLTLEEAKKLMGLKMIAYEEYLAARSLMINGFLWQAAIMMNTCLEKILKCYLGADGTSIKIQHNIFKLLNLLHRKQPKSKDDFNPDFFKMLSKIYQSRYFENCSPGYNFVINKMKFLAEFDCTYSRLEPNVGFSTNSGNNVTQHKLDIQNNNPKLIELNWRYTELTKKEFLTGPDYVYEFRITHDHRIVYAYYSTAKINPEDVSQFDYVALTPTPENSFLYSQVPDSTYGIMSNV